MEDICLSYVELHDAILAKVELDPRSIRLELPFLRVYATPVGHEEEWWARARILITDWRSLSIDIAEQWAEYSVEGGELLEAHYGPLAGFSFSGLQLSLGRCGSMRVVGGSGRFEQIELEKLESRSPRLSGI